MEAKSLEELELSPQQHQDLEDLLAHPGWGVYRNLLVLLQKHHEEEVHNSKSWEQFIEREACNKLIKNRIIGLVEWFIAKEKGE